MNEFGTTSFSGDVEPLLPDGWDGKSDIFADAKEVNETIDGADELSTDSDLDALFNEEGKATEATPTLSEPEEAAEPKLDEEVIPQDDGPKEEQKTSRTLKLKVNRQDKEIDLNSMEDDEIVALLQKGYAFDEMKAKEHKQTYRRVYQEQIDAGMTESVAKIVAKDAADGNSFSLSDDEEVDTVGPVVEEQKAPVRDLATEISQLRALYPNFKAMPDEVAKAVANGVPLLTAYIAYREQQSAKTAASLKKENEVLKQNAASAARAPITGVSGGGATFTKAKSQFELDFEKGFDSQSW